MVVKIIIKDEEESGFIKTPVHFQSNAELFFALSAIYSPPSDSIFPVKFWFI